MPGGYSTFDTLTLDWSLSNEGTPFAAPGEPTASPLPVLARIPAVDEPVADDREPADDRPHPARGVDAAHTDAPAPKIAIEAFSESIDVVQPGPSPAPATAAPELTLPQEALHGAPVESPESEGGLLETLGRLEATIAPYTPYIVLLTLLAAAGLTVLLLRGQAPLDDRAPSPPAEAITEAPLAAPSGSPGEAAGLAPPAASTPIASTVKGPVGSSPRYTDQHVAPHVPIPPVRIADATREPADPTATPLDGQTPPHARLSQTPAPYDEHTK